MSPTPRNLHFVLFIVSAVVMSAVAVPIVRVVDPMGAVGMRYASPLNMNAVSDEYRRNARKENSNKPEVAEETDTDAAVRLEVPVGRVIMNEPSPDSARDYVDTHSRDPVTGFYYPVEDKGMLVGVVYGPMAAQSRGVGLYFPVLVPGRLVQVVQPPWDYKRPYVSNTRMDIDDRDKRLLMSRAAIGGGVDQSQGMMTVAGLYYPVVDKGMLVGVVYGPMAAQSREVGLYFPVLVPGRLVQVGQPPWDYKRPYVSNMRMDLDDRDKRLMSRAAIGGGVDQSQGMMTVAADDVRAERQGVVNDRIVSQGMGMGMVMDPYERVIAPYIEPVMQPVMGTGIY